MEKEIKDFTGFPLADLKEYYSDKDVETVLEFSDEYPEGIVMAQEINENLVTATVSKGSDKVYINSFVGQNIADAKSVLASLGMTVKVDEVYSHKIAKDIVLFQSDMNYKIKPGCEITLIVSKGKELIVVPDISGLSLEEAVNTLKELGFNVDTNEIYDSSVPKGNVISQDKNNEELEKGSTVSIDVSLGKKPSASKNNTSNNKFLANPEQQELVDITGGNGEWIPATGNEYIEEEPVVDVPIGPEPAYGTVSFENENAKQSQWDWSYVDMTYLYSNGAWSLEASGKNLSEAEPFAMNAFPFPDYDGYEGEIISRTVWVFLGGTQ
ncbi:MAG: PASTA domain-containing protein [Erysipelotrichaceae bacterium]